MFDLGITLIFGYFQGHLNKSTHKRNICENFSVRGTEG